MTRKQAEWSWGVGVVVLLCGGLAAVEAEASERASVWRIEGPEATVYLAGSVHLLREEDYPLPDAYDRVYADSERIYFEVDMAEMSGPEAQARILTLSMLEEGKVIRDLLTKETYGKLKAYLKARGLKGPLFDRLSPGMLSITIAALEAQRMGARPDLGVEAIYDAKARADGKLVLGLETAEFQVTLFDRLSEAEQDEMLAMTLQQIEEAPDMLDDLIVAWKEGRAEDLDALLKEHLDEEDRVTELVLYERNAAWVPVIEEAVARKGGNTLFIVGAGHLVGSRSVVEMLRDAGYEVEQVGG